MDTRTHDLLSRLLVGKRCETMENRGNYLQIRLGPCLLIVGANWRVTQGGELVVGSGDGNGPAETKVPALLADHVIESVQIRGDFHDLRLGFSDEILLEVFADSAVYESWNLVSIPPEAGLGTQVVAGPGRSWAVL